MDLTLDNDNIFFVSDIHYNHHKLCSSYKDRFQRHRRYATVDEMNKDIVEKWNKYITKNDTVIFMGDWIMDTRHDALLDTFKYLYETLNFERLYMIQGNHDHKLFKKILPVINNFENIFLIPDCIRLHHHDRLYLCQHYTFDKQTCDCNSGDPHRLNELLCRDIQPDYLVHGHTHADCPVSTIDLGFLQNNVCWEVWYRPIKINELKPTR